MSQAIKGGHMDEQAVKNEQRLYYKNWRSQNKDKVKKYNQNFWLKRAKTKAPISQSEPQTRAVISHEENFVRGDGDDTNY